MAQEKFQIDQEKRTKDASLERRRESLRKLLMQEKQQHDEELRSEYLMRQMRACTAQHKKHCYTRLEQSQKKCHRASTETLRNIRETYERTEEERRRLELESGLYKRWRYGLCDEILLEAKSDHTALAKMNWLDKQVTNRKRYRFTIV